MALGLKQNILDLIEAYEQVLLLDFRDTSQIQSPAQAFGLIVNVLIASSLVSFTPTYGVLDLREVSVSMIVVVLVWTILTRIFYTADDWKTVLSLNLNLLSFWSVITVFFSAVAVWLFGAFARSLSFFSVIALTLVLITVFVYRSNLVTYRVLYAVVLWASSVFLGYAIFYR